MALNPKINRYRDLMSLVPEGAFYDRDGTIIPYKNTPYEFRFTTDAPSTNFGVFLNETFQGVVQSDALGTLVVQVQLALGENLLDVVQEGTQERTRSYLTTRNYATWLAAHSDEFERVDDYIDETALDLNLRTAFGADLEEVWGARVDQMNNVNYDAEVYRGVIHELLQGYRLFGAKVKGHEVAVAALCQVPPLDWYRKFDGKRWVLAWNFLENGYFTTRTHSASPTPSIPGITLKSLSQLATPGAASIAWNPNASTITYMDPSGSYVALVDRHRDGDYSTSGAALPANFVGLAGPFATPVGVNEVKFDIDGKGIISVLLATPVTNAAAVVAAINAALLADVRYGLPYSTSAVVNGASIELNSQVLGPQGSVTFYAALATPIIFTGTLPLPHTVHGSQVASPLYPAVYAGPAGPFLITPANNTLEFDIDQKGIVTLTLPNGALTAAAISVLINAALAADPRYGLPYGAVAVGATGCVEISSVPSVGDSKTSIIFYPSNGMQTVFGLGTATKPLPYKVQGVEDHVATFSVINGAAPVVNITAVFNVFSAPFPDNWFVTAASSNLIPQVPSKTTQSISSFQVSGDGVNDVLLVHQVDKEADTYKGFEFSVASWIRSTSSLTVTIGRSFDGGVTWLEGAPIPTPALTSIYQDGVFVSDLFIYDPDASSFLVRLRLSSALPFDAIIDALEVRQPELTAAYLKTNTIPRSRHRSFFGHLLWAWCPDILSATENEAIGLGTPPSWPVGHIDKIGAAHTQIDRFNVSEFNLVTGKAINLAGVINEAEWSAATLVNLSITPGVPDRFTYVAPDIAGVIEEAIVFSAGLPPHLASVSYRSNMTPETTLVFRDGVPIPRSYWTWISDTVVQLDAAMFSTTSAYVIQYRALYSIESAPIDLGAAWSNYVWFADYHGFFRYSAQKTELDAVTQLALDYGSFQAPLDRPAVPDTAVSRLVRDDGIEVFELPQDSWGFTNPFTVTVSSEYVKPNTLYTLFYREVGMVNQRLVQVRFEVRSATSLAGLAVATYRQVDRNTAVKTHDGYRYHQLRAVLTNIEDQRDVRFSSLVLKGLNLFGVPGSIPGLRP